MSFVTSFLSFFTASLFIASSAAFGAGPGFTNLTQDDFDKVINELSANSTFHSVTGAGSLGSVFGVEVGLVGGLTNTPEINRLSKTVDASADVGRLPHASLLAAVSVPLGFTGELLVFPSVSVGDIKYQQFGGAIKWTATEALVLPFNLAARAFITKNEIAFKQTLNNATTGNVPVEVTVTQENSQTGLQLLVSPNLPVFEPYAGIGMVSAKGKVAMTGATTGTIFGFTSAQNAESSPSSTQYLLGLNVNLLILNLGIEYSRAFGTDSYNAKFGFKF